MMMRYAVSHFTPQKCAIISLVEFLLCLFVKSVHFEIWAVEENTKNYILMKHLCVYFNINFIF